MSIEKLTKLVTTMRPPWESEDGKTLYGGTFYYPEFSNTLLYEAFKEILKILVSTKKSGGGE